MPRTSYSASKLIAAVTLASAPAAAHAEDWQFGLTPYLWLPNIEGDGTAEPPPDGGTPAFEVGPVDYLDNLHFVLMLAGEARRGSWSLRSDVIYIDFSNQRSKVKTVSGPGGVVEFPVDAGTTSAFTGLEAQATIGYWLVDQPKRSVEIFGGLRYLESALISTGSLTRRSICCRSQVTLNRAQRPWTRLSAPTRDSVWVTASGSCPCAPISAPATPV